MYKTTLKSACLFAWNCKFLWILGLILSLVIVSSEFDYLFNTFSNLSQEKLSSFLDFFQKRNLETKTIFLIILFFLPIFLLLILGGVFSQRALILAVKKKILQKEEKILFKEITFPDKKYLWDIFKIGLLAKLTILGSWLILAVLLAEFKLNPVLYLVSFLVYIPLAVILTFIAKFAFCFLVIEEKNFKGSLKEAKRLFFENWLRALIMSFLLLACSLVLNFLFILAIFLLIAFPFLLIIFLYGLISGTDLSILLLALKAVFEANLLTIYSVFTNINLGTAVLTNIAAFLILILFIIFTGFLTLFQNTAWTLFFLKLKKKIN